jgi:hypothetical protein
MIHKIESYMNTSGIIYTFSFLMFILVMFAFEFSVTKYSLQKETILVQ